MRWNDRLSIVPGLRVERYTQGRTFVIADGGPANTRGETENTELLPGLGLSYDASDRHEIFFGVHRGFAPPRTSQAVTSDGIDAELDAELSWNWELGLRSRWTAAAGMEVTAFLMDFENQVVPANESGGASTTDTNAGQTIHRGLELGGDVDFLNVGSRSSSSRLVLSGNVTWLHAENVTPEGPYEGNDLPYAPDLVTRLALDWSLRNRLDLGIETLYTAEQFADQAATAEASADGMNGLIPSHRLWNFRARYRLPGNAVEIFANVNNLTDEQYIVSRAPRGIFPGGFRQISIGASWTF
jgi:Fe(3+) dicitrate transport protein